MRWMRRITKWIGISVAALFGLAVVAYMSLLYINRADEPPSVTALEFEAITADFTEVHVSSNAFNYFVGINAPQGEDPFVQGHTWLEWSRLPLEEQWDKDEPVGDSLSSQLACDESTLLNELKNVCYSPTEECLSKLNEQPARLASELSSENWMLQRYEKLLGYTEWNEPPADSYLSIVTYRDARTLNTLYSLHAWHLMRNEKHQQALNTLDREARFWRIILTDSKTLIGKMVARAVLYSNLQWTNTVLRSAPSELTLNVPEVWHHPLSLQEQNFRETFANEWLLSKVIFTQQDIMDDEIPVADRVWNKLAEPLLQHQATLNLLASNYERTSQALAVQDKQLPDSVKELHLHNNEIGKDGLFRLYNPIGYTLFRISASMPLVDYGLRIADLEGVRRMLLLAAKLRNEDVAAEAVSTRLNNTPIRNPFTDEAFVWDDEKNAITFKGLAEAPEGSYQLPY